MEKQQIFRNRQRIRNNFKQCIILTKKNSQAQSQILKNKEQYVDNIQKDQKVRKRRNTCFNIKQIQSMEQMFQFYANQSFPDLFTKEYQIGQGTQSTVYKCTQVSTGKSFAVKIMKFSHLEEIKTIKNQYSILKTLNHQNIIKPQYLFINYNQNKAYMVLQYCDFQDLRNVMKKTIFHEYEVAEIIRKILNALVIMHSNKICHRDLKPQNILYNYKTKQLKIIDFQIAKMSKYKNQNVQMCTKTGSHFYKAPQMFGGMYNQLIDLWSVGVITYELCVGQLPFNTIYQNDLQHIIQNNQPNYPNTNITPQCESFIKKLLTKTPFSRINAKQALKTHFMLKLTSCSNSSSPGHRNGSDDGNHKQRKFQFWDEQGQKTQDQQNNKLKLKSSLPLDIGIRSSGKSQL